MVLHPFYRLFLPCLVLLATAAMGLAAHAHPSSLDLTAEESAWIDAHRETVFTVAFDPFAGMDSFAIRGEKTGLLHALLDDLHAQTGLRLVLTDARSWSDAYHRFTTGKADILYGANPTRERERSMAFSRPVRRFPYVILARKDSTIQTLGDLDGRRVGFIANDFVSGQLSVEYPNIHIEKVAYPDQDKALKALVSGAVEGFITSGGGLEREYLLDHPALAVVAPVRGITSDMTLAVLHKNEMLGRILNRYIEKRGDWIQETARRTEHLYHRKILRLTDAELEWLENKGEAVVGVAEDYLPFDYYQDGEYKGIAGETLRRAAELVGLRVKVVSGPFAAIYDKAVAGTIDVLNIAMTGERLRHFIYTRPISTERDIIVGLKSSQPMQDVYGLDGVRVAVIDGFWHEEYLRKNLKTPVIVKTADIMESLRLVRQGVADYLIENPTVVEFYINGLGYTDLVKRGNTSKDSFVYFGVNRRQPELASIIDKALTLVDLEEVKYAGIQSVPTLRNEESRKLEQIVAALLLALAAILAITVWIVYSLVQHKAKAQILKERETLLYTDPLTGFFNRNYFSHHADALENGRFPQALLIADLNNLKRVNDSNGHAAGDALITQFALCMRDEFPDATLFRLGGDEFLAVLDNTTEERIDAAILRLGERCSRIAYAIPGSSARISPSAALGYAIRRSNRLSLDEAMALADTRMYQSKALAKKRRTDDV